MVCFSCSLVVGRLNNVINWTFCPTLTSAFFDKPVSLNADSDCALGGVRIHPHLKYILNRMLADFFTKPRIVVHRFIAAITNDDFTFDSTLNFSTKNLGKLSDFLRSKAKA